MTDKAERHEITMKSVLFRLPGMDAVTIRRDIDYGTSHDGRLTTDLYYPSEPRALTRTPAVVFVLGYSDVGVQRILGCKAKEMRSYVSWAQLAAASGLIGVTYSTIDPPTDTRLLLRYLREHAEELGIDERRIGIWACSGNVPNALATLIHAEDDVKCAALCYGYMLDIDGSTWVADAARQIGFTNPCAGKSVEDLPGELPILIVRAGQDETPNLNKSIDRFVSHALNANLPITFVNYPRGPHAFDLFDDSEASREIIRGVLDFIRSRVLDQSA